jgi:hypothetical protein
MTTRDVPAVVIPIRSRENARAKALRLLVSGRVKIVDKSGDHVAAEVLGDSRVWRVSHADDGHGWACSCPARRYCSHRIAVAMVVTL